MFIVSFAVLKLVSLIRSHLFIFAFIPISLRNVLPMFLFSFMVSCFIFKSLGHLEFIFVYGMRECSNLIHLLAAVQLSQHHLKRLFSPLYVFASFVNCLWVSGPVFCFLTNNHHLLGGYFKTI